MWPKRLNNLLMSFFISSFISISQFSELLELNFMHFLFKLFPPLYSFSQFLSHPNFHFLFPLKLLFSNLNNSLKINLNNFNKFNLLTHLIFQHFVLLFNQILISFRIYCLMNILFSCNFVLEVTQLLFIIVSNLSIFFIKISKEFVTESRLHWRILQSQCATEKIKCCRSTHIYTADWREFHFSFYYCECVDCIGTHVNNKCCGIFVFLQITI